MKLDKSGNTRNNESEKGAAMIMALLVSFLLITASAGLLLESSMNAANVTDAIAENASALSVAVSMVLSTEGVALQSAM